MNNNLGEPYKTPSPHMVLTTFAFMVVTFIAINMLFLSPATAQQTPNVGSSTQVSPNTRIDADNDLADNNLDRQIKIKNPRTLVAPKWLKTRPVYMDILNIGSKQDVLVGSSSPVAEEILMQFSHTDSYGLKTTRPLENQEITLPPKSRVRLQPGGMHLMLTGLKRPLEKGLEIPIKLDFLHHKSRNIKVLIQKQQN